MRGRKEAEGRKSPT